MYYHTHFFLVYTPITIILCKHASHHCINTLPLWCQPTKLAQTQHFLSPHISPTNPWWLYILHHICEWIWPLPCQCQCCLTFWATFLGLLRWFKSVKLLILWIYIDASDNVLSFWPSGSYMLSCVSRTLGAYSLNY